jgi:hypothetical protein
MPMKKEWSDVRLTLLFYALYVGAIALLEQLRPSNMCNPGAGMLLLLVLPLVSLALLLKNAFQLLALHQSRLLTAGLHLTACVLLGALLYRH